MHCQLCDFSNTVESVYHAGLAIKHGDVNYVSDVNGVWICQECQEASEAITRRMNSHPTGTGPQSFDELEILIDDFDSPSLSVW